MNTRLRPRTVTFLSKLLTPLAEEGVLSTAEMKLIISELTYLAKNGKRQPPIKPRLMDRRETAEILGISLAHFYNLMKQGILPLKRKKLGGNIRYNSVEVAGLILGDELDVKE